MNERKASHPQPADHGSRAHSSERTPGWLKFSPLLILLAGLCVYSNSFSGVFLFDDNRNIVNNERIRSILPIDAILTSRRPVVELTFAFNYALGGLDVWGYHAVNIAIHILSALVLFGLVRRTLQFKIFKSLNPFTSYLLPWSIALLWVVHPLNTQSVTYLIQRSESCMGLFYLLTLYGFVRSVQSSHARWWSMLTVIFCAMGMGCKAVMITAPVMVLLYDYVFVSSSFSKALQAKPLMYTGLVATWGLLMISGLAQSIFYSNNPYSTVGFNYQGVTPLAYALAQPGVILQYIILSLWPESLCLDYGWRIPQNITVIIGPVVIIFGLLTVTIISFLKKHWAGFVGLAFFLILSPTSSIIPIKDLLFEHRMYLSLICVLIVAVTAAYRLLDRIAAYFSMRLSFVNFVSMGLVLITSSALGYKTYLRNKDYHNVLVMWHDVISKRPDNARAHTNYGVFLQQSGDLESALEQYEIALSIDENDIETHFNYGTALMAARQMDRALVEFQATIRFEPNHTLALSNLGNVFASMDRNDEAIEMYHKALQLNPNFAPIHVNLANTFINAGRWDEAVEEFQQAIQIDPNFVPAHYNLGNAYSSNGYYQQAMTQYRETVRLESNHPEVFTKMGDLAFDYKQYDDAIEAYYEAVKIVPDAYQLYRNLGSSLAMLGRLEEAHSSFTKALRLNPGYAGAHYNLGNVLVRLHQIDEAIKEYREAIQLDPYDISSFVNLGNALSMQGKIDEAVEQYRAALALNPNHRRARRSMERVLAGEIPALEKK